MSAVLLLPAMWLQDAGATTASSDAHWTMIFVGFIAFCFLVIALTVVGAVIAAFQLAKKVGDIVESTTKKAAPALASANDLFQELSPQVRKISRNMAAITDTVKGKVTQFDDTLTDVNDRTKAQVARVDGMVNDALTTTSDIASTIQRGIRAPIREVAGIVAGFKAGLDVLLKRDGGSGTTTTTADPAAYPPASVTPISPRPHTVPAAGRASEL